MAMVIRGPAAPPLTIRLFGPFEVHVHGVPLSPLRSRKGEWLLALLALRAGSSVQRSWLAGTLWPDSPQSLALTNMRTTLADLRRALGFEADRISSPTPHTLCLDPAGAEVDVAAFDTALAPGQELSDDRETSLEQAIALYRGSLLEEISEEWVLQERLAREQAFSMALEALAARAMAREEWGAATRHLRRAASVDPLRETAQRALMGALAAGGNYAAAAELYRELRVLFHRQANSAPDPETEALYQQIRAEARDRAQPLPAAFETSFLAAAPGRPRRSLPQGTATFDTRPHNLPAQPTPLLGREQAVVTLRSLLQSEPGARLLTLTGPGGAGKTRLALQVATELLDEFADGVFFVDLAPLSDPGLVASTIAQVIGVEVMGGMSPADGIKAYVREKQLLLLLDNFEHVLPAARLVADMLAAAPRLTVMVTSRAALNLRWEKEFPVPPLALPDRKRVLPVEALSRYAAVELFIQRARSVKPQFALTHENAPAVAEICHRLDGLPLAIELAAARVRLFPPQTLLARLENRLDLLSGGPQDLPARQQTLRDEIAWSCDLLGEAARSLFRRLSVFVGGCTLEALVSVCGAEDDADLPDGLEELVSQSLVRQDDGAEGESRFRMLETIREYARECLAASDEEAMVRNEHARYFLELAERAEQEFWGATLVEWLDRLEAEHDNMRAALRWLEESGKVETALRLAAALTEFWHIRDHTLEAVEHLSRLLALTGPGDRSAVRAKALNSAGMFAVLRRNWNTGRPLYEEALSIWRERGDRRGIAASLWGFGVMAIAHEEWEATAAFHEESLALRRELGDEPGIASSLQNLGALALCRSDNEQARALYEESLAIWRKRGCEAGMNWPLHGFGDIARTAGDLTTARACYEECLAIRRRLGYKRSASHALDNLGLIALSQGLYEEARSRLEEALALIREGGQRGDIGSSLLKLGHVELHLGRMDEATSLFKQGLALGRESGNSTVVGSSLLSLGLVAFAAEELAQAGGYFEAGRAMFQEMGDTDGVAEALHYRAQLTLRQGNIGQARDLLAQYLPWAREQGQRLELTECLEDVAALALAQGYAADAARLFGAAEGQRDSMSTPIPPVARPVYERDVSAAHRTLGEEAFAAAWAEGRAMPLDQATEIALAVTTRI